MSFEYQTVKVRVAEFVEAKVDEHNLDARLNALGQQGWDLVTSFKAGWLGQRHLVLLFKRTLPGR